MRGLEEVFARFLDFDGHLVIGRRLTASESVKVVEIREFLRLTTRPVFERIVESVEEFNDLSMAFSDLSLT